MMNFFKMVTEPECLVGIVDIDFKRSLSMQECNRRLELLDDLQNITLNSHHDYVIWALVKNKNLSTKSIYRFMTARG